MPLARVAGKPELLDDPGRAFPGVSTSTSGTVGLVAIARHHRIGVDVERVAETDVRAVTDERWLWDTAPVVAPEGYVAGPAAQRV